MPSAFGLVFARMRTGITPKRLSLPKSPKAESTWFGVWGVVFRVIVNINSGTMTATIGTETTAGL